MSIPGSAKVAAFLVTSDRSRAKAFYGETLGFRLTHEDEYALVFDLGGTALRVSTVKEHRPQPHTVLGWEVDDIESAAKALRDKGVAFTLYEGMGQDAQGIWRPPGGRAQIAWFQDPDGNVLSLAQSG